MNTREWIEIYFTWIYTLKHHSEKFYLQAYYLFCIEFILSILLSLILSLDVIQIRVWYVFVNSVYLVSVYVLQQENSTFRVRTGSDVYSICQMHIKWASQSHDMNASLSYKRELLLSFIVMVTGPTINTFHTWPHLLDIVFPPVVNAVGI